MKTTGFLKLAERGSILVLTSFLVLVVTLISFTYWKVIELRLIMAKQREQSIRAEYIARAGLEDAIYEFSLGNDWDFNSGNLSSEWSFEDDVTFYKTNLNSSSLGFIDYPVTYSVQVVGNIDTQLVTVNVNSSVSESLDSLVFKKTLQAFLSKSFDNEIIVHSVKTI
jgi:hypothetical protein